MEDAHGLARNSITACWRIAMSILYKEVALHSKAINIAVAKNKYELNMIENVNSQLCLLFTAIT
jgi:hypothetical protein